MKDFNLKDALAGKPVITRDGRPVKIAGYNPKADLCIVGWVENDAFSWLKEGISAYGKGEYCLFMAPNERKEWVVIYTNTKGHRLSSIEFSYGMALHVTTKAIENGFTSVSIHEITIDE